MSSAKSDPDIDPEDGKNRLYALLEEPARYAKVFLQMVVGVVTVLLVVRGVVASRDDLSHIGDAALASAGAGLAVAAAIELAYTLFTDGPDEAIDPLILGLSAFGLIEVGKADFTLTLGHAAAALLLALAIAVLFAVRRAVWPRARPGEGDDRGPGALRTRPPATGVAPRRPRRPRTPAR